MIQLSLIFNANANDWFKRGLDWRQVQAKAKAENKYIFVDCFTTWCGPCRLMEKNVYALGSVGRYMEQHFISIKLQMDTTKKDNEEIKAWYQVANEICKQYKIDVYPTYLFFSPDGQIVHKGIGYKNEADFIGLAEESLHPSSQYYRLLIAYLDGRKNYKSMPFLIKNLKHFRETQLAKEAIRDYLYNYLFKLKENELYTKDHLEFIAAAVEDTTKMRLDVFYGHEDLVDKIVQYKGFAREIVGGILFEHEILPKFSAYRYSKVSEPNWDSIQRNFLSKYSDIYCRDVLLKAKYRWYLDEKNWDEAAKFMFKRVEWTGFDTTEAGMAALNNKIFVIIVEHVTDSGYLNQAIELQRKIVDQIANPDFVDTYANLLYKAGKIDQAISWEKRALTLSPKNEAFVDILKKMENRVPTWTEN